LQSTRLATSRGFWPDADRLRLLPRSTQASGLTSQAGSAARLAPLAPAQRRAAEEHRLAPARSEAPRRAAVQLPPINPSATFQPRHPLHHRRSRRKSS
jgi:hypothetical protein